jgi:hypothetical protein
MHRALLPLLLTACNNTAPFSGTLDTPGALAELPPGEGPFKRAMVYASDRHGGRIRLLDPARGSYASVGQTAAFLRGDGVGTGFDRLIDDIAPLALDADHVTVFAIDRRFNHLLVLPHLIGRDANGELIEQPVTVTLTEAVGSAVIRQAAVVPGVSASEDWTIERVNGVWRARGSRSGPQTEIVRPGVPWSSADSGLSLVLDAPATSADGDRVLLRVESGLTELSLDGTPLDLEISPDGARLALALVKDDGTAEVRLLDARAPILPGELAYAGGSFSAMTWTEDSGRLVLTAPTSRELVVIDAATGTTSAIAAPSRLDDVAVVTTEAGVRAWAADADANAVWMFDIDGLRVLDVNASTGETDPVWFDAPVRGLGASPVAYKRPRVDENGDAPVGRSIAVSVASGRMMWLQAEDGCLVSDNLGPRPLVQQEAQATSHPDYTATFALDESETAYLVPTEDSRYHVLVNPCAGVARTEQWSIRYDELVQAWRVIGTISGEQDALAYEDVRYVSDAGEISFLIRSGLRPSVDGWLLEVEINNGALQADGANGSTTGRSIRLDMPGDPIVTSVVEGDEQIPYVVVSATGADIVLRVDPRDAFIDRVWD